MVVLVSQPASIHIGISSKDATDVTIRPLHKSMEEYLAEVTHALSSSLAPTKLKSLSVRLQGDFHEKLRTSDISFLPSYHHTLPSGQETGTYLALDVGGSNFRLALVSLHTRNHAAESEQTEVLHTLTFPIDAAVRALEGHTFFEWMADRIAEMLSACPAAVSGFSSSRPLPMGLAWSFPIQATSQRTGYLLAMGKGFSAILGVQGQDLSELIMRPCLEARLPVCLATVVNDGSATLLSEAYRQPSTRMSLVLGTGTNSSIFLPVGALAKARFGHRPDSWWKKAQRVCVNTELSMHGGAIWPRSKWDDQLNSAHERPEFQPFEHLVGGRYLGEIVRLILVEAVAEANLFDGKMPQGLQQPYSMDSGLLAMFEGDAGSHLTLAGNTFRDTYAMSRKPSPEELSFISHVARLVSERAAAYEATAVHALWELRCKAEARLKRGPADESGCDGQGSNNEDMTGLSTEEMAVVIACNGSILEKYPGFRDKCQGYIDALVSMTLKEEEEDEEEEEEEEEGMMGEHAGSRRLVELSMALESSVFGAAVAAACCTEEEEEGEE